MTEILFGGDPEFFVRDRGNNLLSPADYITGTKENPTKCEYGAYHVDGFAVELNIPPTDSAYEFYNSVLSLKYHVIQFFPRGSYYEPNADVTVSMEMLRAAPRWVRALGCEPDFDPYTEMPNVINPPDRFIRSAGGHLHIGWRDDGPMDVEHMGFCMRLAISLDSTVGLYTRSLTTMEERKRLYGQAGAFRPKPYGIEYRVPSNQWYLHTNRVDNVLSLARDTVELALDDLFCTENSMLRQAIDDPSHTWDAWRQARVDALLRPQY